MAKRGHRNGTAPWPTRERRRYPRIPVDCQVTYLQVGGTERNGWEGRLRDASWGGVLMVTDRPIEIGTRLVLGMHLEEDAEPLVASARVLRCREESQGYALGLEFLGTDARGRHSCYAQLAEYARCANGGTMPTPTPSPGPRWRTVQAP